MVTDTNPYTAGDLVKFLPKADPHLECWNDSGLCISKNTLYRVITVYSPIQVTILDDKDNKLNVHVDWLESGSGPW